MNTLTQSQIFFFVSSVGFVVLWIFVSILLFYVIRATKTFSRIMSELEKDIEGISETTVDLLEDMRDSTIFNFLFRKKKRSRRD